MGVNAAFAGFSMQSGDQIKDQYVFTEYYPGFGFFGGLTALTTNSMYAVLSATGGTHTVTGCPVALPKVVSLNAGWTFLPCPYQTSTALVKAVPDYSYAAGDQVKSQLYFAEFYSGFGFFGSLASMEPGLGYKVKVSTGGVATFQMSR
jgi:hypothetical protein